jgi:hypothetical protein
LSLEGVKGPGEIADDKDVALAQKPKVVTKALVDTSMMKLGASLSQEYISSLKAINDSVWNDRKSWFLCFYFGQGDDRLWVPTKLRGKPHPDKRIINFAHPSGKQAARVLLLAYMICAIAVVVVGSVAIGNRW